MCLCVSVWHVCALVSRIQSTTLGVILQALITIFISFFFKKYLLYLFCVYKLIACMCVSVPLSCNAHVGQKRMCYFSGTRISDGC